MTEKLLKKQKKREEERAYSTLKLAGPSNNSPAPLPFKLDDPSTNKVHGGGGGKASVLL